MKTLKVYKEYLKFSSAHFLIFDAYGAEMLHGHNYHVQLEVDFDEDPTFTNESPILHFNVLKGWISERVDQWDEHVLLPQEHPDFRFENIQSHWHVHFRDRYYVFPEKEVILLPIRNVSVEQLSDLLCKEIFEKLKNHKSVMRVRVYVEEAPGQGAQTEILK